MGAGSKSSRWLNWLKVASGVLWLIFLGFLLSHDFDIIEPALAIYLIAFLVLVSAPISLLALGILAILETILPDSIRALDISVQDFLKWYLLFWWALSFALFYLQWFYLVPKLAAATRRWQAKRR